MNPQVEERLLSGSPQGELKGFCSGSFIEDFVPCVHKNYAFSATREENVRQNATCSVQPSITKIQRFKLHHLDERNYERHRSGACT